MNQLLNEVRHDALKKAVGIQFGEQLFALVEYLDTLNWVSRKEGLLALEGEMNKMPQGMKLHEDVKWICSLICNGCDPENVVELATTRYWLNNLQGEDAFMYYIILYALLKTQSYKYSEIDWLLIEFLPANTRDAYYKFRKDIREPLVLEQKATMRRHLFEDNPAVDPMCEEGVLFSSKVIAAEYKVMKLLLSKSDNKVLLTVMKGLQHRARNKILIMMSDKLIELFAEDWFLLEYVSPEEVQQSFIKMLEVFKEVERDLK